MTNNIKTSEFTKHCEAINRLRNGETYDFDMGNPIGKANVVSCHNVKILLEYNSRGGLHYRNVYHGYQVPELVSEVKGW